jgi:hypothetical protein
MSVAHSFTQQWEQGNNSISKRISITADCEKNVSISVPDSSTDLQVELALDVSALKAILIATDQDITVETNDGTTPDDTFTIEANNPLVWNVDCPLPNPFASTVDVTDLYITNASGSAAAIEIRTLVDATP